MSVTRRMQIKVTARQLEVLAFLRRREQWLVGEVADALGVSSAAATKAITRLERKGLVVRSVNVIDRRRVDVRVTRAGSELTQRNTRSTAS